MAPSEPQTYTARWIFPASGPPLERGTLTIRGSLIEAVEPHGVQTAEVDLGNVAIIPGLVNAHTHLDLSGARGLIPPTDPEHFTHWLKGVIAYRRTRTPEQVRGDIEAGLAECLRFGTTMLGDISADGGSWDAFSPSPLRSVVFREMIGLSQARAEEVADDCGRWLRNHPVMSECRPGLSPHAPYSARPVLFSDASNWCPEKGIALSVHIAESEAEAELLLQRTGPFVEFLKNLGLWESAELFNGYTELLNFCQFPQPKLFIHANYLPATQKLPENSTIVYCPRTHAAFGHPPHPFREFQARGVRVCLGTDSLASNPDLDLLAEARFVRERYPDVPGETLLKMVTLFGAEALGWADEAGSLDAGKSADLVAMPLPNREAADMYELLFECDGPRRTMYRGRWRE